MCATPLGVLRENSILLNVHNSRESFYATYSEVGLLGTPAKNYDISYNQRKHFATSGTCGVHEGLVAELERDHSDTSTLATLSAPVPVDADEIVVVVSNRDYRGGGFARRSVHETV